MNRLFTHICLSGLLVLGLQQLSGQIPDTVITDLPAEEVEVIKSFEARIEDARKVKFNPTNLADVQKQLFQYNVVIRPIELVYPDPAIKPVAMVPDQLPERTNGFIRAGYGSLNTIQGLAAFDYLTEQETHFSVAGNYLYINNKQERFQKYQDIDLNAIVDHNLNSLISIKANVDYNLRDVYFFGSPLDNIEQDTSKYKRQISDVEIGAGIYNGEINEYDIDYSLDLNYQNIQFQSETLQENNFKINGEGFKKLNENIKIGLKGAVDISSILDTSSFNYNNYFIGPEVIYNADKISISGALTFGFDRDNVYYLPNVLISYSPFDSRFIPYAYWKGDIQKNNINGLKQMNPFISTNVVTSLTNTVLNRYGIGAKGLINNLSYDANVSYGTTKNLLLFNSTLSNDNLRQFEFITDSASVFKIMTGLQYVHSDQLSFDLDFVFNDYQLTTEKRPWHLPAYRFDFKAKYSLLDNKLHIKPSIYFRDGVYILDDNNLEDKLNPLVDFNAHLRYDIKKNISVYAEFNNILSSEYQRWYKHSYFGLSAIGGVSVTF